MLDLQQLQAFVVLCEELHFGRAATRLNVTQPPLTRQIQALEKSVGIQLLQRTTRSVQLPPVSGARDGSIGRWTRAAAHRSRAVRLKGRAPRKIGRCAVTDTRFGS